MITKGEFPVNNELEENQAGSICLCTYFHIEEKPQSLSACAYSVPRLAREKPTRMKISIQAQPFTAFSVRSSTKESHKDNKSLGKNP